MGQSVMNTIARTGIIRTMKGRTISGHSSARVSAEEKNLSGHYRLIIGAEMRRLRLETGMTQEAVGDELGIYKTGISAMEKGTGMIGFDKMLKLAEIYGAPRKKFGVFLLRYTNPWLFALIYGDDDPELRDDLGLPPTQ